MARSARPVVLLAVMAVLAGCAGPGFDKAGGTRARPPVVLTMASFLGGAQQRAFSTPAGLELDLHRAS